MPDRDEFSHHVAKRWRGPARRALFAKLNDQGVAPLIAVAARDLAAGGCPGLQSIAEIVASHPYGVQPGPSLADVLAQLDAVKRVHAGKRARLAIRAAQQMLQSVGNPGGIAPPIDPADRQLLFTASFVIEFILANAFPSALFLLFSRLLERVLEKAIGLTNRALWRTKAEMCRDLLSPEFEPVAQQTVSCDRFPWISVDHGCGRCTSCLLRRMALSNSGRSSVDGTDVRHYDFDVFDPHAEWSRGDLRPIYAMRIQAERLRACLSASDPLSALSIEFPELGYVLAASHRLSMTYQQVGQGLQRLIRAHLDEWDQFVTQVAHPGWGVMPPVASLLPPSAALAS